MIQFDSKLPLKLTTDASSTGIGAILSHEFENECRPIAFASRVLNKKEFNYSQVEKEALAVKFGVEKFYQYLFGQKFIIETDMKALLTIFGSKKGIPTMVASRLQRWATLLSGFNFEIQCVKPNKNISDCLSRSATDKNDVTSMEESSIINCKFIARDLSVIDF